MYREPADTFLEDTRKARLGIIKNIEMRQKKQTASMYKSHIPSLLKDPENPYSLEVFELFPEF